MNNLHTKKPWRLFYSYADEDEEFVQAIDRQLAPLRTTGNITREARWEFLGGSDDQKMLQRSFAQADMMLLFVSASFISSPLLKIEAERAMQRAVRDGVYVIPILLRPVNWQQSPFAHLSPLPRNREPVTKWRNREEAFYEIAEGIRKVIDTNNTMTTASQEHITGRHAPPPQAGQLIFSYQAHSKEVYAVAWSPDGGRIASGGRDGEIHVWRAENGQHLLTYRQQIKSLLPNAVLAIAWSSDSRYIASGTNLEKIQVWDAHSGQKIATRARFSPVPPGFHFLAWSPQGYTIASTEMIDHAVHVWNGINGQELTSIDLHSVMTTASPGPLAWSSDGRQLVAGWDRFVHCYYIPDKKRLFVYDQHKNYVIGVAWSRDQRFVVSCDKTEIHVWYRDTLATAVRYVAHNAPVRSFALSPDGRYVASCSEDRMVHVWETMTGRQQLVYRGHDDIVTGLSWSPDGKRIASASHDRSVQVWQAFD